VADVILINPHYVRRHGGGVIPPVGLCYLAAALRDVGATVVIIDLAARFPGHALGSDAPLRYLRDVLGKMSSPELVGVGPLVTATFGPTSQVVDVCKSLHAAPVITGGPLCAVPGIGRVLADATRIDGFVAGDGEQPIVEVWQQGLKPAICGFALVGDVDPAPWREMNLDVIAPPARDLLSESYAASWRRNLSNAKATAAYLSRGCPYSCSFCAAPLSSGKIVRRFSPQRVELEIAACHQDGFEEIIFYDDCLFVRSPKLDARVLEFVAAVERSGWSGSFQLELRCDAVIAISESTLDCLATAGCRQINMGIEKGHAAQMEAIRKRLTPQIARDATSRVVGAGIRAAGTFILGGPGESISDIQATIEFAESLDLDFAHFNPLAIYPGTTLFDEVFGVTADWHALSTDPEWAPFGDILWRDQRVSLADVLAAVENAYERFYSDRRLSRVIARLPAAEREAVAASFSSLRLDRGRSWDQAPASKASAT
jgi:anaerobic magnesium-protoporphyrin IX monomethyl ester cyclase